MCFIIKTFNFIYQKFKKFNTQKTVEAQKIWRQRPKSVVLINEQCYTWKNNGKSKK